MNCSACSRYVTPEQTFVLPEDSIRVLKQAVDYYCVYCVMRISRLGKREPRNYQSPDGRNVKVKA